MSLEAGSPNFRVIPTPKFTRTAKDLKKGYKGSNEKPLFVDCIANLVELLTLNPRPVNSRLEPWPGGKRAQSWEFRKLVFQMPNRTGASGEGRLMYLVNDSDYLIQLIWIYTHDEFKKRPPDKSLKQILRELLDG